MTTTFNGFALPDLDRAVANSAPALDKLAGAAILITGGTGFFGQWLLATLIHANRTRGLGAELIVLTRAPDRFRLSSPEIAADSAVRLVAGDVRTFSLDVPRLTHVIHAATDTSVEADARPLELMDTIVAGTRRVLEIARAAGALDVLFVSSGGVYGGQGEIERVPETYNGACDPTDRRSVYGESKRLAELLCTIYRTEHGLRPRIARCFAFVGPGMPLAAHFAIGNFVADAIAGRTIEIKGDGTPMRSYLYAGDLAAWLLRALVLGKSGAAYNVGSDHGLSIREIAEAVAAAVPTAGGVKVHGVPQPGAFRSRYVPAVDRARADLGAEVWTDLASAVVSTAAWARARSK